MAQKLACPQCGSTESLTTVERILGNADGGAVVNSDGSRDFEHGGETEISWDSSETIGVECVDCLWSSTADRWIFELAITDEVVQ